MITAATTIYQNTWSQATAGANECHVVQWVGLRHSWADGYEHTAGAQDDYIPFSVDTGTWPNRISQHKYWIRVHTDQGQFHQFLFYWCGNNTTEAYQWDHLDELTGNFAPIPEAQEVMPEHFMKFLERIGHDDDYLRLQLGKQKEHWDALEELKDQYPPWDPRAIERLEQRRLEFLERFEGLKPESKEKIEQRMMERWGMKEIPPITPELLDQIQKTSRKFLAQFLSPAELKMYTEEGHIKIQSPSDPAVIYIVKKGINSRIERHVDGEFKESLGYFSKWGSLPHDDIKAMQVFDLKFNEEQVLKISCKSSRY